MVQRSVMTFNIRGAPDGDGIHDWEQRAHVNVRILRRYLPDLIGFQELQLANLETYERELPEYSFFLGKPTNRAERQLYNAIAWKPDLLELTDGGSFYLSETPSQWSQGWDSARVRGATWAQFRVVYGAAEFLHINTHLDHSGVQAQLAGASQIIKWINEFPAQPLPVILTGDFNTPADGDSSDTPYTTLRAEGFEDTYLKASVTANPATFHGFQGPTHPSTTRMDWILTLDGLFIVRSIFCQIVRDSASHNSVLLYPSDHYPVLAGLKIEPIIESLVEIPDASFSVPIMA